MENILSSILKFLFPYIYFLISASPANVYISHLKGRKGASRNLLFKENFRVLLCNNSFYLRHSCRINFNSSLVRSLFLFNSLRPTAFCTGLICSPCVFVYAFSHLTCEYNLSIKPSGRVMKLMMQSF